MDAMAWLTVAIFAITIVVVISNVVDSTVAALIGVTVMIWIGVMTEVDAFGLVDWNVMAILVSVWTIAAYFGKTGVPSWLSVQALQAVGRPAGPAGDHAVGAVGHDLDVRRQRGRDPDDGAGGAAAGAGAEAADHAAGADDRFLGQLHGLGHAAGRPAAADAAQRGRRRVHGFLLAPRPAVVVSDPGGDLRDHAGRDVRLRFPRLRPPERGHREARHRDPHPQQAVRRRGGRLVPAHRARHGDARGVRRQAGLHRADRRDHAGAAAGAAGRARQGGAVVRGGDDRARLARHLLLRGAVRAGRRAGAHARARRAGAGAQAGVHRELRARRHVAVLGDGADRGHRRARRLHPDLPAHHQGPAGRRRAAVAAVVDVVVVGHAGQQPHGGRRPGAVRRAQHLPARGGSPRVAARVPVVERAVHRWCRPRCAT